MDKTDRIQVALDKNLLTNLIDGIYGGAKRKVLKVVIDIDGRFHIESKDMRMIVEFDESKTTIKHIHIHNEKQFSEVTFQNIKESGLTSLANDTVKELKEKFNTVHHSLADSICVFGRTYSDMHN